MKTEQNTFQNSLFHLLVFYSACFIAIYLVERFFFSTAIFSENNFLNWDAMHYNTIRQDQYFSGMVAFFPLFPYLWKITHLGSIGISVLNGTIFIVSLAWLASLFNIKSRTLLLLASVPSLVFMFLPFSESIFFLTSIAMLAGWKKNNFPLLILGIVLSGLARPVATVFIPAILVMHYFSRDNTKAGLHRLVWMIFACGGSMLMVFILQYYQTGEWLSFIHVQEGWGNYLRLPVFPLNSWAGGFIVRLDAIAFFFGIVAAVYFGYLLKRKIKSKSFIDNDRPFLFSLCYLALLSLVILFTRGGVLNSLNRYLFCSAFFIVAMHHILSKQIFNKKSVLLLFLFSSLFWLLFASYVHIQAVLKFEFLSIYLLLLLASNAENRIVKYSGYYSVLACNVIFMIIFYHRFLSGAWLG